MARLPIPPIPRWRSARLRHPYIVNVLDFGFVREDDGLLPYFTMELLHHARPINQSEADFDGKAQQFIQLLQGVDYLHRNRLLHRDLKPSNVLLTANDSVRVVDFGLAVSADVVSDFAGTLTYLAPELIAERPASIASDLFAVGLIGCELFADQHPFAGSTLSQTLNNLLHHTPDLAGMPPQLLPVFMQLLEKDPADRHASARAVMDDFCRALNLPLPDELPAIREAYLQAAAFTGRVTELATLSNALDALKAQRGSLWLIGGESGVGKSRLTDELRIQALVRGVAVIQGEAADSGIQFNLWIKPIKRLALLVGLTDDELSILQEVVADLGPLIKRPLPPPTPITGDARLQPLIESIVGALRRINRPTLLILNDLHWSRRSLRPLSAFAAELSALPLMIVGTYRDDERPELPQTLPTAQLIKPQRLDEAETRRLAQSMLGDAIPPEVIARIRQESEGNPFFMVETLRTFADAIGRLDRIAGAPLPEIPIESVHKTLQKRLDSLSADYRDSLITLSLIGREVDLLLLQTIAALPDDITTTPAPLTAPRFAPSDWLLRCVNLNILESAGSSWSITHAKLREMLLETIDPADKPRYHRRAAAGLERIYGSDRRYAAQLVKHWQAGQRHADALRHVPNAIALGLQWASYHEVRQLLESVDHPPAQPLPPELLIDLANICMNMGDDVIAETYLQRADEAPLPPELEAKRLMELSHLAMRRDQHQQAIDLGEQAYQLARTLNDPLLTLNTGHFLTNAFILSDEYERAAPIFDELEEIAQRHQVTISLARVIEGRGKLALLRGQYAEAIRYLEQDLDYQRTLNNRTSMSIALLTIGVAHYRLGKPELAADYTEQAMKIAAESGNINNEATCSYNLGEIKRALGDNSAGRLYLERSLQLRRQIQHRQGIANTLLSLSELNLEEGQSDLAAQQIEEAAQIYESIGYRAGLLAVLLMQLHMRWRAGEIVAGWQLLRRVHPLALEQSNQRSRCQVVMAAALLIAADDPAQAAEWAEFVRQHPTPEYDSEDRPLYDELMTVIRPQLDNATFEQISQRAAALELEPVLAAVIAHSARTDYNQ